MNYRTQTDHRQDQNQHRTNRSTLPLLDSAYWQRLSTLASPQTPEGPPAFCPEVASHKRLCSVSCLCSDRRTLCLQDRRRVVRCAGRNCSTLQLGLVVLHSSAPAVVAIAVGDRIEGCIGQRHVRRECLLPLVIIVVSFKDTVLCHRGVKLRQTLRTAGLSLLNETVVSWEGEYLRPTQPVP